MEDLVAPAEPRRRRAGQRPQRRRHRHHARRLHGGLPGLRRRRLGRRAVPAPSTAAAGSRGWSASPCRRCSPAPTWRFSMCPLLTQGAIDMLLHHGSEEQQETYLPKMVTGEWTGTMNLTEPQAGSDVGALAHQGRAAGRRHLPHHRHEDLHHLRRARHDREHHPPRAGPHARRAPRHQGHLAASSCPSSSSNDDGTPRRAQRRHVRVASSTRWASRPAPPACSAYGDDGDGAVGYLIGEENAGMRYMFTMMNNARLVGRRRGPRPGRARPTRGARPTPRSASRAARPARPAASSRSSSSTPTCAACCSP